MNDTQLLAASIDNLAAILNLVFSFPDASLLSQAFGLGLTAPLTFYLVSYCVGLLVSMFNPHERG